MESEKKHSEKGGANRPMKPLAVPRYEGSNLVIDLDEEDYLKGVEELKFSMVGQLYLPRICEHPTTMEIKDKLGLTWGITEFKLVPVGGDHYHIVLRSRQIKAQYFHRV